MHKGLMNNSIYFQNLKLLKQFLAEGSDEPLPTKTTGICQTQFKKLQLEIAKAVDHGMYTGLDKQLFERQIVNIFLPISFNICFGCSKEPSH